MKHRQFLPISSLRYGTTMTPIWTSPGAADDPPVSRAEFAHAAAIETFDIHILSALYDLPADYPAVIRGRAGKNPRQKSRV
jgi:hypothetical protein